MRVLISDLIEKLEETKAEHGDIPLNLGYYCDNCDAEHQGDDIEVIVEDGMARCEIVDYVAEFVAPVSERRH